MNLDHYGGSRRKKHQGLGKKQVEQREKTEKLLINFLKKNQPVYFNKIFRESKISDPYSLNKAIHRLLEKKRSEQ